MIVGIGVDVCDLQRMARELDRDGHGFRDEVFTPLEVLQSSAHLPSPFRFAARFAAKEAALKALGAGLSDAGILQAVEVRDGPGGTFTIRLHDRVADLARARGVTKIRAACVTTRGCALAGVVLESGDGERL